MFFNKINKIKELENRIVALEDIGNYISSNKNLFAYLKKDYDIVYDNSLREVINEVNNYIPLFEGKYSIQWLGGIDCVCESGWVTRWRNKDIYFSAKDCEHLNFLLAKRDIQKLKAHIPTKKMKLAK